MDLISWISFRSRGPVWTKCISVLVSLVGLVGKDMDRRIVGQVDGR